MTMSKRISSDFSWPACITEHSIDWSSSAVLGVYSNVCSQSLLESCRFCRACLSARTCQSHRIELEADSCRTWTKSVDLWTILPPNFQTISCGGASKDSPEVEATRHVKVKVLDCAVKRDHFVWASMGKSSGRYPMGNPLNFEVPISLLTTL